MKLIDTIHLDEPSWGVRKVRQFLIESGVPIGRRHCNTIFRKLGIHCIYRKPRTTIRHIGHKIFPYLLRHLEIVKPNQVWAMDITYIPMAKGFVYLTCVMDIYSRSGLAVYIRCVCCSSRRLRSKTQHGWKRCLDRQHFHRAFLALTEERRGLLEGL